MLTIIAKLIGALSSYGKPGQVALAFAIGLSLALIPAGALHWYLVLILMFLVKTNQAAFLSILGFGSLIVRFCDPLIENLGVRLLGSLGVQGLVTSFFSLPLADWTRLDDSLVFGGTVLAVVLLPVFFFLFLGILALYRRFLAPKVMDFFRGLGKRAPLLEKFGHALSYFAGMA